MSGKKITIIFCAVAALLVAGFLIWDVSRGKVEILLERNAIEKAAGIDGFKAVALNP